MISYEVYKVIHLFSLVLFFTSGAIQLVGKSQEKIFKILTGVATLFILVSGMGLLARIGVSHDAGWPLWAVVKVIIWLVLGALVPIAAKRFPDSGRLIYWAMMGLFLIAAIVVNFKIGQQ